MASLVLSSSATPSLAVAVGFRGSTSRLAGRPLRAPGPLRATTPSLPPAAQRSRLVVTANKTPAEYAKTALEVGNKAVDGATNLVPDSVPRPVAKAGVAIAGLAVVTSVAKSLLSTMFTVAVLGGLGYWFFLSDSGGSGGGSDDDGDALDEARKIMDKYK